MEQKELLKQAMQTNTPEELLALAKEHGMELTGEQAKAYFDLLRQMGELTGEELEGVSGGEGYFYPVLPTSLLSARNIVIHSLFSEQKFGPALKDQDG